MLLVDDVNEDIVCRGKYPTITQLARGHGGGLRVLVGLCHEDFVRGVVMIELLGIPRVLLSCYTQ